MLIVISILPKPPKMEIALKHMDAPAFVGETVVLNFDVCNEEDEVADASIHADVLGYGDGGRCISKTKITAR